MMTTPSTPCELQRQTMERLGFQLEQTDRCGVSVWSLQVRSGQSTIRLLESVVRYDDADLPNPAEVLQRIAMTSFHAGQRQKVNEMRSAMQLSNA